MGLDPSVVVWQRDGVYADGARRAFYVTQFMDGLASVDALAGAIPYLAAAGWLANAQFF